MHHLANCFGEQISGESVRFLTKLGPDPVVVEISASILLTKAESVIHLDGDSLAVLSHDGKDGILIDYNADDEEQVYELSVWGERWPITIMACE